MLNPYFFHLPCGDRPFVMAKWAMSVDGRIRTGPGAPKWISCQESRLLAHRWRSTVDAVCVGIGTVLADDPLLTCRVGLPSPKRVVFDSSARTPLASQLVRSAEATAPVLIVTATRPRSTAELDRLRSLEAAGCTILTAKSSDEGIDLPDALRLLHSECAIHTIMVEGGGRLLASVLRAGLVDETRVFVAPVALGCDPANAAPPPDAWASDAIARFLQTQDLLCHRCGSDLLLIARRRMQA
jgi:diaminohydroxyphosphoribosylaminopyrimidine deaminase/5-amino-6-(5-phosphoribosylamino)uracil reductase